MQRGHIISWLLLFVKKQPFLFISLHIPDVFLCTVAPKKYGKKNIWIKTIYIEKEQCDWQKANTDLGMLCRQGPFPHVGVSWQLFGINIYCRNLQKPGNKGNYQTAWMTEIMAGGVTKLLNPTHTQYNLRRCISNHMHNAVSVLELPIRSGSDPSRQCHPGLGPDHPNAANACAVCDLSSQKGPQQSKQNVHQQTTTVFPHEGDVLQAWSRKARRSSWSCCAQDHLCASILKGTVKCGIRTTGDLLATHFLFGKCLPELVWGHSCGMTLGKA